MVFKLNIADSAHKDLNEILAYIAETLCAPDAAARFADAVDDCYVQLKSNPLMYAVADMPELAEKKYRRAVVKNHLILYKVDEASKTVYIYRIFYGRRDYINLI